MTEQLELFPSETLPPAANGNGHVQTKSEAGLAKVLPAGAERLLAEMVKRGLSSSDLKVAAMLALALEEEVDRR